MLFDVISSRSALSGPGNSGQRFAHLQPIIHTEIGRDEFGWGMTAFWRILGDEPNAFLREFWQLLLQSSLTALGEKRRPVCVGTWRRLTTAEAMKQWRPRFEEANREVRWFGVAVPGGVEHVELKTERYTKQATGSLSLTAPPPVAV